MWRECSASRCRRLESICRSTPIPFTELPGLRGACAEIPHVVPSVLCRPLSASMPKRSAGILMYRRRGSGLELLLVHPGGPFWAKKDWGAWSIPKGEYSEGEDALAVAMREFEEETGARALGS